jgi:hypothetical protein
MSLLILLLWSVASPKGRVTNAFLFGSCANKPQGVNDELVKYGTKEFIKKPDFLSTLTVAGTEGVVVSCSYDIQTGI